ncbi:hypothetical protein DVH24_025783 [Malus domestica]|uniref:Uncharacterized protein n=1 Tax=Malus domestica TaxID=3750 RepID=A0A498KGW3_MALDO|nr:hypothetical protein DVH24_025783 [Malus domestica]
MLFIIMFTISEFAKHLFAIYTAYVIVTIILLTIRSGYLCSAKPSFFHDGNRANLFEVELESGMLINTDNGSSTAQVGWRTMLVVPELEREVELLWELRDTRKIFLKLLVKLLNVIALIRYDDFSIVEKQKLSSECNALEFHKSRGQLMKTGYHNSHFAHQVD